MRSARQLPYLLLALLVWGFGAPLVAVTCVPSAPCAGMMEGCPTGTAAERPAAPAVASPDCCEQAVRDSEPPAVPGAKVQALDVPAVATALVVAPPSPSALWLRGLAGPTRAAATPLYTLHSILLI
jgi:hypothetical protein